jgi:type II secretory pathway pseudopilin PulG
VIIGIIAAITVPTVIANSNANANLAKIKKNYSTFSQAIMRSKSENGPIDEWYEAVNKEPNAYFSTYLKPYINIMRICEDYNSCGYNSITPWKFLNNSKYNWNINTSEGRLFFYLLDGVFIALQTGAYSGCSKYNDDGSCAKNSFESIATPNIIMDINGPKKPNVFGKDVFFMSFSNSKGVIPYGDSLNQDTIKNDCSKGHSGFYCLKYLMLNGWNYPKGYPI